MGAYFDGLGDLAIERARERQELIPVNWLRKPPLRPVQAAVRPLGRTQAPWQKVLPPKRLSPIARRPAHASFVSTTASMRAV